MCFLPSETNSGGVQSTNQDIYGVSYIFPLMSTIHAEQNNFLGFKSIVMSAESQLPHKIYKKEIAT